MYQFGQNPLKDVDSRVFTRMLRKDGRTDGSVTMTARITNGNIYSKGQRSETKCKKRQENICR